jgi:hypothetical protein
MAAHIKRNERHIIKRLIYSLIALPLLVFSFPPLALADDPPAPDTAQESEPAIVAPEESTPSSEPTTKEAPTETPTLPAEQGPQSPPGPEASTYSYNQETGLWENTEYTWDPVTKQTRPKTAPTYSYNPSTGHWDTTEWVYDAPSGKYIPNIISTPVLPEGADVDKASLKSPEAQKALMASALTHMASNAGPGSSNQVNSSGKPTGIFDLFYNAFISNDISSSAISGDALVNMNTLAGSALSGDAKAIATIFNLLQSSWNLGLVGSAFHTFTQSIYGNLIGDLLLSPGQSVLSAATPSDITINASGNAAINNTITLEAVSGDASVTNNTSAGDATTGSATAIANIINAINSSIITGHSFIGMLNIYGSLDGDILLPPDLIMALLAANAVGTLDTSQIANSEIIGNFNNDLGVTNNVSANATSGDATVATNTSAGNAASGNASTNVTLLNLTGRKVVGKNALLVFVNVLGKWVGVIVDAPAGATSAALGSGITQDSSLEINDSTTQTITNDINVTARSGDALVSNNTSAGNATSGDANAAVNILNLNNSQFALSDWFGVLFINVFGTWNGSFGIDTPAGTLPPVSSPSMTNITPLPSVLQATDVRAFRFVPHTDGTYTLVESDEGAQALTQAGVLSGKQQTPPRSDKSEEPPRRNDWIVTAIGLTVAVSLLGTERVLNRHETK